MLKTVAKAFALEVDFGYVDYFEANVVAKLSYLYNKKLQNPPYMAYGSNQSSKCDFTSHIFYYVTSL